MKRGNQLLCAALPHQAELPQLGPAGRGAQEGMGEDTAVASSQRGSQRDSCSLEEGSVQPACRLVGCVDLPHGIRTGLGLRNSFSG